ncbi:hypothetical protein HYV85_05795 [Candidatus Woesearchaeota archaeon]|nr:hypothetical protein [Candidatus Woesearchaeota archaeon]
MVSSVQDLESKLLNTDSLLTHRETLDILLSWGLTLREHRKYDQDTVTGPSSLMRFGAFTILTREFVTELYIELRRRRLASLPILEICAGKGLLSHHLRKLGAPVIATDDYSTDMVRNNEIVERLSHVQALEKYNPRVVLGSWLPQESRIGDDVLNFPSVDYFLVIGESVEGATWLPKGYEYPDFKVYHLANVSRYALGASDFFSIKNEKWKLIPHTSVRLFKRKGVPMSIDHAIG